MIHPWFQKRAGQFPSISAGMPSRTYFGQYDPMSAQGMLQQHASPRYAKRVILESPDVSPQDKYEMVSAVNRATRTSPSGAGGSVQLGQLLPALAGAGLGYMGASLIAPILGLDPKTKNRFGIGAAALGAVVNSAPQWLKGAATKEALDGPVSWLGDKAVNRALDRFQSTGTFAASQNPVMRWMKQRYLANPRNQEYIRAQLMRRLQDPQFLSRAFQNA